MNRANILKPKKMKSKADFKGALGKSQYILWKYNVFIRETHKDGKEGRVNRSQVVKKMGQAALPYYFGRKNKEIDGLRTKTKDINIKINKKYMKNDDKESYYRLIDQRNKEKWF